MLWHTYPDQLDSLTLKTAYESLQGDPPSKIPFIVWLFENPNSPIALPGCIDLYGHDCLHLILKQGFTPENEAYVLGFTMGNDTSTNCLHLVVFLLVAQVFYPGHYRLRPANIPAFMQGLVVGRQTRTRNLNQCAFKQWESQALKEIRAEIGLELENVVEHGHLPQPTQGLLSR